MNKNKYIVGVIGLVVGFAISFYFTQKFNRENVSSAEGGSVPGMNSNSTGGQQAGMAQVQQTIEKAKANPTDFGSQVAAAEMFNQIGRMKETVEYLERAYAASPDKFNGLEAAAFVGQYYFEEKKFPEAETWFNRAIKADPSKPDYYVALAETFVQREPPQPDRAIDYLQQSLKLEPKSGHALGHLIEAYALKRDARSADDTLSRLKEADPSNKRLASLETMVADLKAGKPVSLPQE